MRPETIEQLLLFDIAKLRAPEGYLYAGWPNYHSLFGRDSLIAALQLLPVDLTIARTTLYTLAHLQATKASKARDAEPGKILHEFRISLEEQRKLPHWKWPYYGSVDATSLFLMVLDEYISATDDIDLLSNLWPNATLAVKWHLNNSKRNRYGFITYQRQNPYGLFHQGWKDSSENHLRINPPVAIIEEQGYAYKALKTYASLAHQFSMDTSIVAEAEALALKIKENLLPQFWMEKEQYFAIAIDDHGNQRKTISSNPGHLLLCGDLLNEQYAKTIIRRLLQKDMWSAGGIRTLSANDPDFDPLSYHLGSIWPHDNWMVYRGCKQWGFTKESDKIKTALFRAYLTLHHIPELYGVVHGILNRQKIIEVGSVSQLRNQSRTLGKKHLRSSSSNPIQAWAAGALLNMLLDGK